MIKLLLHIRPFAFIMHKKKLASEVDPIKLQDYTSLKKLIISTGVSGPNEEFAYARFLKATEFARYRRESGCVVKYRVLRELMGLASIDVDSDFSNPTGVAPR